MNNSTVDTPKPKRPIGRPPTQFKPEYCEKLIEHMKSGYSFESFGAKIPCGSQLLWQWFKEIPEFSKAKEIAESYSRFFWEDLGIRGIQGEFESFNASSYIFTMKNRFHWRDNVDLKINGKVDHTHELTAQATEDLKEILGISGTIDVTPKQLGIVQQTSEEEAG